MKKRKIKWLIIISSILSVVLISGGILTYFLTRTKTFKDSGLFETVGEKIYSNNQTLAGSYNQINSTDSQVAEVSHVSNVNDSSVLTDKDTFNTYITDANLVLGYYAVSEYLNEQENIKLNKTYYFKSSTTQYHAIAKASKNSFSFKLKNDFENIEVIINYKKDKKEYIPLTMEFYQKQFFDGFTKFLSATIDFEKSNYTQVSFSTPNKKAPEKLSEEFVQSSFTNFNYFYVDYNNFSKYKGFVVSNVNENTSTEINKTICEYYKQFKNNKSFDNFNKNFKKKTISFPNPEDLQVYAFNKYEITLEKNENGDYILVTSQKNGIKAEILEALNSYNTFQVPNDFESLNYTFEGNSIEYDLDLLHPKIDTINSNIKNWLELEYNENTYYYKTLKYVDFQILINSNKFIYAELEDFDKKIVLVESFADNSWSLKYYHTNNTNSYYHNIKKTTSNYQVNTTSYISTEYSFEKIVYDLKVEDLDFNGNTYNVTSLNSVSYFKETNLNNETSQIKYTFKTKSLADDNIASQYEIYKSPDFEQNTIKRETAINENYLDSIKALIKKINENSTIEESERPIRSYFCGDLSIGLWQNKMIWNTKFEEKFKTIGFKIIQDNVVVEDKTPLKNQYNYNFKGGIVEIIINYIHKDIEKTAYLKLKINKKFSWKTVTPLEQNFSYTLTNNFVKFNVSNTVINWEFLGDKKPIKQNINKNGSKTEISNTQTSFNLGSVYSGDYTGSLYIELIYDSIFGENTISLNISPTGIEEVLKPVKKKYVTGYSFSLNDHSALLNWENVELIAVKTYNLEFNQTYSDLLKREIYYREDINDLSEFDESELLCVTDPETTIVYMDYKYGLYQIKYDRQFEEDVIVNMIIKQENGYATTDIYIVENS